MASPVPIAFDGTCELERVAYSEHMVVEAEALLFEAFKGQTHRDGKPAFLHSMRVAFNQKTYVRTVLALLHDIVEDAGSEYIPIIREQFGQEMVYKVILLTRMADESYEEYIKRVATDEDCIYVKLADIEDNMHPARSDEKARANAVMYGRAYDFLTAKLGYYPKYDQATRTATAIAA